MHSYTESTLKVSGFDRTKGLLTTAIFVCSFICIWLFAVWLTNQQTTSTPFVIIGPPGTNEPSLVTENPVEYLAAGSTSQQNLSLELAAVTQAISKVKSGALNQGQSNSLGFGDNSIPGIPSRVPEIVPEVKPEHRRWKIQTQSKTASEYFELFDYFDIELGAVHKTKNSIVRLENSNASWKLKVSNRSDENNSFYFVNTNRNANRWDQTVVKEHGLELKKHLLVHFYPENALAKIRSVEAKRLKQDAKEIKDVVETEFEIVKVADGFEFRVSSITYRD